MKALSDPCAITNMNNINAHIVAIAQAGAFSIIASFVVERMNQWVATMPAIIKDAGTISFQ